MANNYTQLQADIVSMLARGDLDAPLFIRIAEMQLGRFLRLRAMLTTDTLTPATSGERQIASLPSDFLEALHLEQSNRRLNYRSPDTWDAQDEEIYTIMGTDVHVTAADDVSLWYYASPTALSDTNLTNIYTTACYDGLLYLSLSHGYVYMNRPDKAQQFAQAGILLAKDAQQADNNAEVSGATLIQRGG